MSEASSQLAFYFDSRACSGCKACQVACKDKHQLPVGILWRRVYEVTGGGWKQRENAWESDVFAYNLSLSCNHCTRPICVEVCPARAITKRADGIVLISSDDCLGCRYCSWACPYGALQYDERHGRMTKCTLCVDNLERGEPPACVSACPMRTLDYGRWSDLRAQPGVSDTIHPLASPRLTEPALVIKRHPEALRANIESAGIGNSEEVGRKRSNTEQPLVFFTLLVQLSVGAFGLLEFESLWISSPAPMYLYLLIPAMMAAAMLVSFLHLGSPLKSWRAMQSLRSSWLSREIFFTGLFFGMSSCFAMLLWLHLGSFDDQRIAGLATAFVGFVTILVMGQVYRLRTVPTWNLSATSLSFFATTFLLGSMFLAGFDSRAMPALALLGIGLVLFQKLLANIWTQQMQKSKLPTRKKISLIAEENAKTLDWRWGLGYAGILSAIISGLTSNTVAMVLAFVLMLVSEVLGRFMFYENFVQEGI